MTIDELARSYTNLGRAMMRFPKMNWEDALAHGQLQSKAWAVDELVKAKKKLGTVYIVGGWIGTLAPLLFSEPKLKIDKIRSFDIDPECEAVADQLNVNHVILEWQYKAITMDMLDINYDVHTYEIPLPGGYYDPKTKEFVPHKAAEVMEIPNTIINTSCDHIAEFRKWWDMIPKGKLVLIQNNDFKAGGDDHVNTVESLEKFIEMAPMSKTIFEGERRYSKYNRYMLIGYR